MMLSSQSIVNLQKAVDVRNKILIDCGIKIIFSKLDITVTRRENVNLQTTNAGLSTESVKNLRLENARKNELYQPSSYYLMFY